MSGSYYYAHIQLVSLSHYSIHYVQEYVTVHYRSIPLLSAFLFSHSLLLPIRFLLLTWNPPCCDRIRPPRSQVARKLIFPFPSPYSYTPHSKIPTPRGLPEPNIHSLGRHREPGSQDPAQYICTQYNRTLNSCNRLSHINWGDKRVFGLIVSEKGQ